MVKKCRFWKSKSDKPYAEELTVFINVNTANLNEYSNWILDKDKSIVKEKREITKINIVKKYLFISFVSKLILEKTNLNFIYILLVIIGGSFFSTSSGLRFLKIYSLTKYSINQILSFSRPKNVFMNKLVFSKINFDTNDINKYFLTILIFVISLFSLTILLSLSSIQFEYSFKLAVLTLMNTVNSSAYGVSDFDFQNLHFLTKYFLIFFMIIGRVELLSLLIIAKKFLFKN